MRHEPSRTEVIVPSIETRGLSVWFPLRGGLLRRPTGWLRAVDAVSLSITQGETLALVGESGSGKTTLGRALVRIVPPTKGHILMQGQDVTRAKGSDLAAIRRHIQMVFQDPYSSLDPLQTVGGAIAEPLEVIGLGRRERTEAVDGLLASVGLSKAYAQSYPHELSGGQRQRVAIARALAPQPRVLICDEPLSALDVSIRAQIINLLQEMREERGLSYLFITHDLRTVRHIADRIAVMYRGAIVEVADAADLYQRQHHPYTLALLSAIPVPDPRIERTRKRVILTGDVPRPADQVQGCRFQSRCWLRTSLGNPEICENIEPSLQPVRHASRGRSLTACHFPDQVAVAPISNS